MGCDCSKKPTPGPHGNQKPAPPSALVASVGAGAITHVAPDGTRTPVADALAARAAIARRGGLAEFN